MKKLLTITIIMISSFSWAQIPQTLSFQGVLVNPSDGQAVVDSSYTFIFSIYNVDTGGSALWTETQTLTTSQGQYSAILGSVFPIDITGSENYWLGIQVDPSPELGRVQLTSSAYLLDDDLEDLADGTLSGTGRVANSATTSTNANTADAIVSRDASGNFSAGTITANLTGNVSGSSSSVTGTVAGSQISSGINGNNITTGSMNGNRITAGTIGSSQIANRGVDDTDINYGIQLRHTNGGTPISIKNTSSTAQWNFTHSLSNETLTIKHSSNAWGYYFDSGGSGAIATTSDRRLKENIMPLNYGLKEILKLNPVSYNFKNIPLPKTNIGLIAQEVQDVISEIVCNCDDQNDMLALDYTSLIPVLIKALQEQQAQIEDLKSQFKELQNASGVTAAVTGKE